MKGETARSGETIECPTSAPTAHGNVVFSLVEKDSCLLATQQIHLECKAVHLDVDVLWNRTGQNLHFRIQIFFCTRCDVIASDDTLGLDQVLQHVNDLWSKPIHALVQQLQGDIIAVSIHDEPGKQIPFGMHHPV